MQVSLEGLGRGAEWEWEVISFSLPAILLIPRAWAKAKVVTGFVKPQSKSLWN